jgi:hypothetical protein
VSRSWFSRLAQNRFSTRGQALVVLLGTWAAFLLVSWLLFEALHPGHGSDFSLVSHLKHLPEELEIEFLMSPFMMPPAILALFHRGNLFHWGVGGLGIVFATIYWPLLGGAVIALLWTRRHIWWFIVLSVLLLTAPRLGELIYAALLVT